MHATYRTIDERPTLGFERRIAHPAQAVWQAITEPSELAHWFPTSVEVDLRSGGAMTFTFPEHTLPDGSSTMHGEVTELDPPRLFAFYWGDDHLRFELEPVDGGAACVLRVMVLLDARDKAARDAAGWHVCLDRLERQLSGASATAPGTEPTDEWQGHYQEYQRLGLPTGAPVPGEG
jgi:uncharacterized protein YndB with AHSA1/START domain